MSLANNQGTLPGLVCPFDGVNPVTLYPLYDPSVGQFTTLGWECTAFPNDHNGAIIPLPANVPTPNISGISGQPIFAPNSTIQVQMDDVGTVGVISRMAAAPPVLPVTAQVNGVPTGLFPVNTQSLIDTGVIKSITIGQSYYIDMNGVLYLNDTIQNGLFRVPVTQFDTEGLGFQVTNGTAVMVPLIQLFGQGPGQIESPVQSLVRVAPVDQPATLVELIVVVSVGLGVLTYKAADFAIEQIAEQVEEAAQRLKEKLKRQQKQKHMNDDIVVFATPLALPVNSSEQGKPTPIPPDLASIGLQYGHNPNFGTNLAAQALEAAILTHPAVSPFTESIPGAPESSVIQFNLLSLAALTAPHARGFTWRKFNNTPWSIPADYLPKLTPAVQADLVAGNLQYWPLNVIIPGTVGGGRPPIYQTSALSGPQRTLQIAHGRLGFGIPPKLSRNPSIPPTPYGGYQVGVQYLPFTLTDPSPGRTHWIQVVGCDNGPFIAFMCVHEGVASTDTKGNVHVPAEIIVLASSGLMPFNWYWMLDVTGDTNSGFYDIVGGRAGPGVFTDLPAVSLNAITDPFTNQSFQPVPPEGVTIGFAVWPAWWIDSNRNIIQSPLNGPGPNQSPIAISCSGFSYEFRAQRSPKGELLLSTVAFPLIDIWTDSFGDF